MKPLISYADNASESLQWGGTIESASWLNNVSCVNNFQFVCVTHRKDTCLMYESVFTYVAEWFNTVLDDWDDWKQRI